VIYATVVVEVDNATTAVTTGPIAVPQDPQGLGEELAS
jgi:hypothetical protein